MTFKNIRYSVLGGIASIVMLSACKYQNIVPANYPDQKIYMSTANLANNGPGGTGIYSISAIDVPDRLVKYTVDNQNKKFSVLFGVLRSSTVTEGEINVSLAASADTIGKLITLGKLNAADTQVLPSSAFSLQSAVTIPDGQASVVFPLVVDMNYLIANQGKKFALAVSISNTQKTITPLLGTTILLIDTKIFFPIANYTFIVDAGSTKKLNFNNTSAYGLTYTWDFGDGSAAVTTTSPAHTFASAGTYNVKLTAVGISGTAQQAVVTKLITVL